MRTFICILTAIWVTGYSQLFAQEKTSVSTKIEKIDKDGVYLAPDQLPEFPGGIDSLLQYLNKNIKYPAEAQKKGYEGRVIAQVVIDEQGRTNNVTIVRSIHPLLDAEAIRVISTMPLWTPGKDKGKNVPVRYTIPIMFRINRPIPNSFTLKASEDGITNTSLLGVWQMCSEAIKDNQGTYHIKTLPFLKIISPNHTFMNIFMRVGNSASAITAQGSYEQPQDSIYIESIDQSGDMAFPLGTQNRINLEFLHDNLIRLSFPMPNINNKWVEEFWIRVLPPKRVPLMAQEETK